MRRQKNFILILLFSFLQSGLILGGLPVLYPNFPLFIGPSSNWMLPEFGSILAKIDTVPGLETVLHLGNGSLYVWHYSGNILSGFPKTQTPFPFGGSTVGDLDNDGENEIVNITLDGWLDIIDDKGNSRPNFPLWTGLQSSSAPVLADLDNDQQREIIFYNVWEKEIYVYKSDGTIYPGWPQLVSDSSAGFIRGIPAVGDLDGDGDKEIVAFTLNLAYAWDHTGKILEGWPVSPNDSIYTIYIDDAPPVLADLDKDGKLEIIASRFRGNNWPFEGGVIEVYDYQGGILAGWPKYLTGATYYSGPAVGDLDKDGSLEIVVYSLGYINILKANGEFYPGWPLRTSWTFSHQPILVDLNENDSLEILLIAGGNAVEGSRVFAFGLDKSELYDNTFMVNGFSPQFAPAVGDVKKSDSISLLIVTLWGEGNPVNYYAYVYLYDLGVPYDASSVQWGTYGHNNRRTNNYHDSDICNAKPGDASGDKAVDFADIVKIVDYLFRGDTLSGPKCSLDPNFDRKIKLSDVVYLINFLFRDGIPPIPYDDCCLGN